MDNEAWGFIENFLKEYDYPLIEGMNSQEKRDVLHINNRCHLISWAFKVLNPDTYVEVLKEHETDQTFLADLLRGHGFCLGSEMVGFFTGDLSMENQVKIIYKIFKSISQVKNLPPEKMEPVSVDEIINLTKLNLNLFPQYGDIKKLTEEEKISKTKELEKELQSLESTMTDKDTEHHQLQCSELQLKDKVDALGKHLSHFEYLMHKLNTEKYSQLKLNYTIDPSSTEVFSKCCKYIKTIHQYIADTKTIQEFAVPQFTATNDEFDEIIVNLVDELLDGSEEILYSK